MNAARFLVVGYGSIGERHARLLTEVGHEVAVVTSRPEGVARAFMTLREACTAHRPQHVIVANDTDRHADVLEELAALGHPGTVLVEKPVFDRVRLLPAHRFQRLCVAYNLRFHPVLQRLRAELEGQPLVSVQVYAGQYLPEWRPGTDYRSCYSAHAERGGGVLLDLSHDLDYLGWLTGPWQRVAALGGRFGPLEITSDDVFTLLVETARCPVASVQLNYLDRTGRRQIVVNTHEHTYDADLVRGQLRIDRGNALQFTVERDATYRAMHLALARGDGEPLCAIEDGLDALALVDAARQAARTQSWIQR